MGCCLVTSMLRMHRIHAEIPLITHALGITAKQQTISYHAPSPMHIHSSPVMLATLRTTLGRSWLRMTNMKPSKIC